MSTVQTAWVVIAFVCIAGCQNLPPKRSSHLDSGESTPVQQTPTASAHWNVDFESTMTEARESGKLVLAFFTGSDFCQPCARLKSEVFSQPEFAAWSADDFLLLELDYPQRTRQSRELTQQNRELAERFRDYVDGYPTVLVFDGNENVLAKMGYKPGGPHAWISSLELQLDSQLQ